MKLFDDLIKLLKGNYIHYQSIKEYNVNLILDFNSFFIYIIMINVI